MPAAARRARPPARLSGAAEARLAEKDRLSAAYMRDRKRRIDALCDGDHGEAVKDLARFLRKMDLGSGKALVERIRAAEWAQTMNADDRHLLLSIVSGAIRKMREREGLPPLDDPIFDQPPNVFQQIKLILRCE